MSSKFGANGEQLVRFLDAAQELSAEHVEQIVAETRGIEVRDARSRISDAPQSAASIAAVESAVRDLVKALRGKFPPNATTAERMAIRSFTSLLGSAVFALASRPKLDDNTVGLVLDPFAERLGFEWRSWGVSSEAVKDGQHG